MNYITGKMGVGLSEYRASIGAFAFIAVKAGAHRKTKSKQKKPKRPKDTGEEETEEKVAKSPSASSSVGQRPLSLNGSRPESRSRDVGRRSRSLSQGRNAGRPSKLRRRSLSPVKRVQGVADEYFKNSCISCKTDIFNQRWQRGRCRQSVREKGKETHCPHMGTELKKGLKDLNETEVFFLTSIAVSGCIILEQAIFTIVQILLIRSGVETNPGPTSQTCCLAYQHFKRVKNTIEKAQNNFKSKITDDTLTKKVIEIEETGRVLTAVNSFD